MGCLVLLLLMGLPAAEIWVLIKVGALLGFWNTVFLLVFSAFLGGHLARIQGRAVLLKVQQCMAEGRVPTDEMIDGVLVLLGGILFVIPGFITDAIGLLFIFPPARWLIRKGFSRHVVAGFAARQGPGPGRSQAPLQERKGPRGPVQDAEIIE